MKVNDLVHGILGKQFVRDFPLRGLLNLATMLERSIA